MLLAKADHTPLLAWHSQMHSISLEPPGLDRILNLGQVEVRFGDGDGWSEVELALRHALCEDLLWEVTPRVDRDNGVGARPRRVRPDLARRQRVGEVWAESGRRGVRRQRDRPVDRVGAAVRSHRVATAGHRDSGHNRPSLEWVSRTPAQRLRVDVELGRVGGELDHVPRRW
eukprot:scaffold23250_cov31-Tisochrysis_lutea.AAC.1